MMKRIIIPILATLTLLAGCAKEPAGSGEGIPMRVAPALAGETKASMQTADLQEFYLQLGCADAAYGYFGKVSKSGTAWSAAKQLFWKDETTPVSACAAYFGGHAFTAAEFSGGIDLAVPADQSTQAGLNSADLLTLKAANIKYEDTEGGVLPVELSHGLAKVNFVITLGDALYDAGIGFIANPVTALTVKGANTGFNFKPQSGAVTVTAATQADITPLAGTYTPGTATAKAATAVYEAILVPQSFAAGKLSVSFSIGTGSYTWTNAAAITLAAGNTYNLPISATTAPPVDSYNGHGYVDLGLPSGLKWATCNVGATAPEEYGDYFAWGDTVPCYSSQDPLTWRENKTGYNWASYTWCNGSYTTLTKYCSKSEYGKDGFTDAKTTLDPEDDAAGYQWGGSWRMPAKADIDELIATRNNTDDYTWTWCDGSTTKYAGTDVAGWRIVRNSTGATLFLPAAGYRGAAGLSGAGSFGRFWSSSLDTGSPHGAWDIYFYSSGVSAYGNYRYLGLSVRPVTE